MSAIESGLPSSDNYFTSHSPRSTIKPCFFVQYVFNVTKSIRNCRLVSPPGASDSRLFQPEWASLRMLAVSPQHRGQGIGRQLSLECVRRAKQDKAEVVGLHTSELMVAARRMYERLGFKQEIELPRHLGIKYWRYVLKLAESLPAR
jgi:ribosomal protein S18 acetylase RimI-like enzyme